MEQHAHRFPLPAGRPAARALLQGGLAHPQLSGEVLFYPFHGGTLIAARVFGLPADGFYGFHVHETGDCTMGGDVPFHCAGGHFNPTNASHPHHAGDLPVLLSSGGMAYTSFYTGRFQPAQVLHRALVIHDQPDDFRTNPAGNSGTRIACGIILPM